MKPQYVNFKLIIKIVISCGIIILLIIHVDFVEVWQKLKALSLPFVAFALLYYTICQWLSCIRWKIILKALGFSASINLLLSSYFCGMFLNTCLPGTLGGDVYRVYTISRKSQDSELAFVSVFLERVTGLFALLGIALLSIPPAFSIVKLWDIILLLVVCTGIVLGIVLLILSPRLLNWSETLLGKLHLQDITHRFRKIQILLRHFRSHTKALMATMIVSLIFQLLVVYYYYLIAQQLNIPISYLQLLVFNAIIVVITLFPISLGGLGVKEGLLAYLFNRIGLTIEQALLLSITVTILSWLLSLFGGLIILRNLETITEIKRSLKKK